MGTLETTVRRTALVGSALIDRQVERLTATPSAIALEDVLLERMPWLREAVVLEREQRLVPVVATRGGAFDEACWQAATKELPTLQAPIVLEDQAIPRTATGKVQRAVLSALVFDGRSHDESPITLQASFVRASV